MDIEQLEDIDGVEVNLEMLRDYLRGHLESGEEAEITKYEFYCVSCNKVVCGDGLDPHDDCGE